ncbi:uncharacterized protein LDX57_003388 [Aspergillus melleus]|uniref:uncharacterized protein n=1 Tax=Aspergillus melleus TaxID=138277 RepID=UPI001E8D3E1C|nr:uncharacterized protein LDX57_003388 [Aspergillus melleus]KAH8425639.1 hypothetical protein LDX57_003388 [Aspergillus melleus]
MTISINPAKLVLSILKERDIPVKGNEVTQAFDNEPNSRKNAEWMLGFLSQESLLSQEELTLYNQLESSGALQGILGDSETTKTRPLLDEDLRKAIESLNTSTAAIQKQTEILQSQCESLNKHLGLEGERALAQKRESERLRQKHEWERQSITNASNELAEEVSASLKNESERMIIDGKRILSSLSSQLKEDDRTFAHLERLASGVKSINEDALLSKQASELIAMLTEYTTEDIQHRLDRSYLEGIQDGHESVNGSEELDTGLISALEGELESLYPEIDVLAEVSTKQQHGEPILRELHNHHEQLRVAAHKKLDYVTEIVTELVASAESSTKRLQDRESVCGALETLSAAYQSEVKDRIPHNTVSRSNTMKRRSVQFKPTLTPAEESLSSSPEHHALAGLLRRTGLSLESVFQPEECRGAASLDERRLVMLDCLRGYGVAADAPLMAEMGPTDRATRLLSYHLNASGQFEASLRDAENEDRLSLLDSQLRHLQQGIGRLNLEGLHRRNHDHESFMARWS